MTPWKTALTVYKNPKMLTMLILGFFSGLPLLLIFSTLSFWLTDCNISKTAIGAFALVRLPYSFKFLWAPYVDRIDLPVIGHLGRRRSWALVFQTGLMLSLLALIRTNPAETPLLTAGFAVAVAFFSASQDIVFDAFRIESFSTNDQGAASATFVTGYRIGMLASGAGALYMSVYLSWTAVYTLLAVSGLIGMATILFVKEPLKITRPRGHFFKEAVIAPIKDFLSRDGWFLILLFIMLYKLCETTLGTMTAPFYTELGFSRAQIATVAKIYGVLATIVGGIAGGALVVRFGIMKSLVVCGILQGLSNLPFAYLATQGDSMLWLSISVISDNMASGMATSAFVAYMSFLCNTAYTATQYALLSSIMALPRDLLSSGSGWLADRMSWPMFFTTTALFSLPGLFLLFLLHRKFRTPAKQ